MKNCLEVAVLGAGHGGHAMAGHLALKGFRVKLYNKFEEEIIHIRERGGIVLEGEVEGFARLETVTTDIEEAISEANVIMVVVPAFVHRFMAEICASHLKDGQIIVLNPGRTGGALEFLNILKKAGVKAMVFIAEAHTLVYTCRISGPAQVLVKAVKRQVPLAALPATDTKEVLAVVRQLYPQFIPAINVLETSLDNIGAVFHPSTMVLNANRIEAGEEFDFYGGMTPTVTGFLEVIDRERMDVARAYGIEVESAKEWLTRAYEGITGATLYECIQSNLAYQGIKAPKTLNARYITEDVPCGLVPIVSFAEVAGLSTPASRAIVDICCALMRRNYWEEGRTVENLGLAGMSVEQIVKFVTAR